MKERIAGLQREYRKIHDEVVAAFWRDDDLDFSVLQAREVEIVTELRRLGARVYPQVPQ